TNKLTQNCQSVLLTFLRVKLRREQIISDNGSRKLLAILCGCGNDRPVFGNRVVGVDKVDKRVIKELREPVSSCLRPSQAVPTDLRHFQPAVREPSHDAVKERQTFDPRRLFASLK